MTTIGTHQKLSLKENPSPITPVTGVTSPEYEIQSSHLEFFGKYKLGRSLGVGYLAQVFEATPIEEEESKITKRNGRLVIKICSLEDDANLLAF